MKFNKQKRIFMMVALALLLLVGKSVAGGGIREIETPHGTVQVSKSQKILEYGGCPEESHEVPRFGVAVYGSGFVSAKRKTVKGLKRSKYSLSDHELEQLVSQILELDLLELDAKTIVAVATESRGFPPLVADAGFSGIYFRFHGYRAPGEGSFVPIEHRICLKGFSSYSRTYLEIEPLQRLEHARVLLSELMSRSAAGEQE